MVVVVVVVVAWVGVVPSSLSMSLPLLFLLRVCETLSFVSDATRCDSLQTATCLNIHDSGNRKRTAHECTINATFCMSA